MGQSSLVILITVFLFLTACAQGHCRRIERQNTLQEEQKSQLPKNTRQMKVYKRRVLVYKYDESKQCQAWASIDLDQMVKELGDIKILSQQKKHDGYSRIQVCGSSTGIANVYQIYEDDLEQALKKGFKLWKFD
ncbi:MAG: hypothetical protein KDD58_08375 [Bdellovibrionales bacterium]|nr:hypothetical protein [Bdellovibrionales bacterium]